jgi:hypothetical protein
MLELTEDQRRRLEENGREPLRLYDPVTHQEYVVIRAEVYDRFRTLLYDDAPFDPTEAYPLIDEAAAKAGWDDPAMDIYNDLAREQP